MKKNKLILILLFLLLLLIILCTWCHSERVAKNYVNLSTKTSNLTPAIIHKKAINFYLDKDKKSFELIGNFSQQSEIDKIHAALGINDLKDSSTVNTNLRQNSKVISLMQKIIPHFYDNYDNGSIQYKEEELIVEGVVETEADKNTISTLLANSTIPSKNNTILIKSESSKEALVSKEQVKLQAQAIEIEIKRIISFEDINFELNKATLTEKSIDTISQIAIVLNNHPNIHVEIGGHTDNTGDQTYNLTLSQARVDSVKSKLTGMQILAERIKAVGYGSTQALVSNDTEENRRKNRRVEFKVIGE